MYNKRYSIRASYAILLGLSSLCLAAGHKTQKIVDSTWNCKLKDSDLPRDYSDSTPYILSEPTCVRTAKDSICMAAGWYGTRAGGDSPLLLVSKNGNSCRVKIDSGIDTKIAFPNDIHDRHHAQFYSVHCAKNGDGFICAAVGKYHTKNEKSTAPLVAISTDGNHWNFTVDSGNNDNGNPTLPTDQTGYAEFRGVSCSETLDGQICVAVGNYATAKGKFPLTAVGTNGNPWIYHLDSGNGGSNGPQMPSDSGVVPIFHAGEEAKLNDVSCAKTFSGSVCVAVGQYPTQERYGYPQDENGKGYYAAYYPLLAISTDNGNHWSYKIDSGKSGNNGPLLPSDAEPSGQYGQLYGANCSETGNGFLCAAVGAYGAGRTLPLFYVSTDGNDWRLANDKSGSLLVPQPTTQYALFDSVNCLESTDKNPVCAANGYYSGDDGYRCIVVNLNLNDRSLSFEEISPCLKSPNSP